VLSKYQLCEPLISAHSSAHAAAPHARDFGLFAAVPQVAGIAQHLPGTSALLQIAIVASLLVQVAPVGHAVPANPPQIVVVAQVPVAFTAIPFVAATLAFQ
jgi:hypothetical protein